MSASDPGPVPDWWTDPRLAFAEGGRVGYAAGLLEALEVAADLYGPWKFNAAEVWRGLERRRAAVGPAGGSSAGPT